MARPEKPAETEFATRLREIRRQLGDIERGAFAKEIGVAKSTLAGYEQGSYEPTVSVLKAYAERFKVNIIWLITGDGRMFDDQAGERQKTPAVDPNLLKKLARIIDLTYRDASIKISPEDISAIVGEFYNQLHFIVDNLNDNEEVEAALPILKLRLKRQIEQEKEVPGSGKQMA